ncbi:MAG TPA: malto-oligosyltrehalose synthase [Stellaceae bacterium]|jgi:(1->4)-alpha-D-glucan 1-alpha-D-glucosylmutase|nr:malto-oligosyltrehalose synthase [Stellaceae bacterium]
MSNDAAGAPPEPPRATYRLQFSRDFKFRDALKLVPYLAELGISHLYASPIMEARPGSTHGYDIVNHNRLNAEIGSDADFAELVAALQRHGLGLILDIVPNHMGIGGHDNPWWLNVLEWGEKSSFAPYFDINWDAVRPDLKGRVLLPVLGDQYGAVLEGGEIVLRFAPHEGSFNFWYFEHQFPVSPLCYATILAAGGAVLADLARAAAEFSETWDGPQVRERAASLKRRLAQRAASTPEIAAAIKAATRSFAGKPDQPASFDALDGLLDRQAYRIAYWRVAAEEINYRRFFNINDLAALRMELPELFAEAHRLIFAMIERGEVQGLRIDHIDGLFDPAGYAVALRDRLPEPFYIVVEKILAHYEALPAWPIAGTTGYDFVNQVLGLFIDPDGERPLTRLYRRMIGRTDDFDTVLLACKYRIMDVNLSSEMNVLAARFHHLSMRGRHTRDFTLNGMLGALREVVASFPVYRTYVSERGTGDDDRRYIDWAVAQAKKRNRAADTSIFDFIHDVLSGDAEREADGVDSADRLRVAMQFQQVTGPVMAKAAEDTAFYRYFRLLALNEVGGDPRRFSTSDAAFHHLMRDRGRDWRHAMVATATHDTKRGEDARIRLAMLSEMPREWGHYIARWLRFNRSRRSEVDGAVVPDRNIEYLFYQSLVGVWPPGLMPDDSEGVKAVADRVAAYMIKAVREGKEESGWSNPNADYEAALERFVRGTLDASRPSTFLADFCGFIEPLARLSAIGSLAQLALKLTVPGIPDIYQGCELWDFSLVDPDNRRPPDWAQRQALLSAVADDGLPGGDIGRLADTWRDGREKLFVTQRLLGLRKRHPALFAEGDYAPLHAESGSADHICAFARQHEAGTLVVAVPRLIHRLHRGTTQAQWDGAELPLPHAGEWRDVITGHSYRDRDRLPVAELLRDMPVAVLLDTGKKPEG